MKKEIKKLLQEIKQRKEESYLDKSEMSRGIDNAKIIYDIQKRLEELVK